MRRKDSDMDRRGRSPLVFAMTLAVPLMAGALSAAPAAAQSCPVKIGGILPLTGSMAPITKKIAQAAELAIEHVNQGGGAGSTDNGHTGDGGTGGSDTGGHAAGCAGGCATPGDACCNGMCADTTSDPANCGGCGHACGASDACVLGSSRRQPQGA